MPTADPAKLPAILGEIKTFCQTNRLKEFLSSRPAAKRIPKAKYLGTLRNEEKVREARDSRKKINEAVITETRGDEGTLGTQAAKQTAKGLQPTHTFQESLYISIALSIQLKDTGCLNRMEKQNVSFGSCLQETALKTGSALKRRDGKPHPNQKGLESQHSVPHSRLTKQTSN